MLCDAHNHLHDERLKPFRTEIFDAIQNAGISKCVVNGTHPDDWDDVLELWQQYPDLVIPALGLHPWRVKERPSNWFDQLEKYQKVHPQICIGECGLDKWIHNPDLEIQKQCFEAQLELAARHNLPISIHCLKAWGSLLDILQSAALPKRGLHIHGFGGSAEIATQLLDLNAKFSFCGYFLEARKELVRQVFANIPAERLMVETDAPDMLMPPNFNRYPLHHPVAGPLNSPANLEEITKQLAKIRGCSFEEVTRLTKENFNEYFIFTPPH